MTRDEWKALQEEVGLIVVDAEYGRMTIEEGRTTLLKIKECFENEFITSKQDDALLRS